MASLRTSRKRVARCDYKIEPLGARFRADDMTGRTRTVNIMPGNLTGCARHAIKQCVTTSPNHATMHLAEDTRITAYQHELCQEISQSSPTHVHFMPTTDHGMTKGMVHLSTQQEMFHGENMAATITTCSLLCCLTRGLYKRR
jgi:hypothetical protein